MRGDATRRDVDQCRRSIGEIARWQLADRCRWGEQRGLLKLRAPKVNVAGEEEVGLSWERVKRRVCRCTSVAASKDPRESCNLSLCRPAERKIGKPTPGGRGGTHPSAPSISKRIRRLNSRAYSIGSSLVKTSRKPWTMRFVASFSVMPRLIR